MSQHPIMEKLAAKLQRKDLPAVKPGDSVRVQVKIKEGDKERVQAFEGTVISMRSGPQGSFTVRKVSFGQGVERIFPFNSKVLDKVEIVRSNQGVKWTIALWPQKPKPRKPPRLSRLIRLLAFKLRKKFPQLFFFPRSAGA